MMRCAVAAGLLALSVPLLRGSDPPPERSKLPPAATQPVDFLRDIKPLFAKHCLACHSPEKRRGGLRLDEGKAALQGGDRGAVLKPGDAARSRLLLLVAGLDADLKMPPKGPLLTAEEVGRLRAWIDAGAKWPDTKAEDQGQRAERTSRHWAFQPLRRPVPPEVKQKSWVRNDLDHFVLARLEKESLAPSPEADRATLLRRLSLDLLGLPPTPLEVDDFLRDSSPGAYERLVDRLLASPHYGERWGRHWLDLARYADSDGYEKDTGRPYAWRYRQWVIEALNRDLPFDQFTVEQLAGDLVPGATTEQKVATGFHRNTLTNKEGGVDKEQFRVEQVVDRVNTTAKVWLGLTLGCAQCHDHKYDPLSQREYYQFFAFFNSDDEADLPAPLPHELEPFNRKKAEFDRKKAELQAAVKDYQQKQLPPNQQKWEAGLRLPELRKLPANVSALLFLEPAKRSETQAKELAAYYAKIDPKFVALTKAVTDHDKAAPKLTQAQTLALGPGRKTHVLIRGDFLRPGIEVAASTPAILPPLRTEKPTRLDLATWLVDPGNPLTPRVTANWVWQRYFGRGLVATLEDLGTQGEKPAHPELLDWLATELVQRGWSLKAFHKLIVTSATYRQSSKTRPDLVSRDPLNTLLARQARLRLEAEVVRDLALAASGLLVPTIGGPSVRPPQPPGISELTYANSAKWVESTGSDRYRRGLYTWFQRTSPYPMLMTFDAPDSNVCCVRRERSNTPLQALTLLNDTVFVECAQALGKRILDERPLLTRSASEDQQRLRHAFRLCLAREPTDGELAVLGRLFDELRQTCRAEPETAAKLLGSTKATADVPEAAAWVVLARAIMNLDEFVTRE